MLRRESRAIAINALSEATKSVRVIDCPRLGWLRAVRDALGISRDAVAKKLKISPAAFRDYETGEADERISLATLRRAAGALGCDVVLALVPKDGRTFDELARRMDPDPHSRATEHSMQLEGQGTEHRRS